MKDELVESPPDIRSQTNDENKVIDLFPDEKKETPSEIKVLNERKEYIKKLVKMHQQKVSEVCALWLRHQNEQHDLALQVMTQILSEEEVNVLMSAFDEEQKNLWREQVKDPVYGKDYTNTLIYIEQELKKEFISPSYQAGPELFDLLSKITVSDLEKIYENKRGYIPSLLSFLSSDVTAGFLNRIDADNFEKVVDESLSLDNSAVEQIATDLKNYLEEFFISRRRPPFVKMLLKALGNVGPEKERTIFKMLHDHKLYDDIKLAAWRNLPFDAVFFLPKNVLSQISSSYPTKKMIEILTVLDDEQRTLVKDSLGEEGSKALEIIDMELEQITPQDKEKLVLIQESIFMDFIKHTRLTLKEQFDGDLNQQEIIARWMDEYYRESQ